MSTRDWSDAKVSDRYLIDVDPRVRKPLGQFILHKCARRICNARRCSTELHTENGSLAPKISFLFRSCSIGIANTAGSALSNPRYYLRSGMKSAPWHPDIPVGHTAVNLGVKKDCEYSRWILLTHWSQDKMAAIFQTTFSNAFSWMKIILFWLRCHWNMFSSVQLTLFQHWFS